MISNQILQSNIEGLKEITRIDLCVCDVEGKVLASTFEHAEEYESSILAFVDSPADSQVISGYQFFKVFDEHQLEYILLAKGGSDDVYMVGKLAAFQIQNLLVAYKERFDKAEKRASIFRNKTKLIEGTVLRLRSQTGNCHNDPGGDHETAGDRSDQRPRSPLSENQQINTQRKTDRSDQKQEAGQVD